MFHLSHSKKGHQSLSRCHLNISDVEFHKNKTYNVYIYKRTKKYSSFVENCEYCIRHIIRRKYLGENSHIVVLYKPKVYLFADHTKIPQAQSKLFSGQPLSIISGIEPFNRKLWSRLGKIPNCGTSCGMA